MFTFFRSPRLTILLGTVLSSGGLAFAQIITTFAGNDQLFTGTGQQATAVQIAQPSGVAVDKAGNVYIAAIGQAMVLKVAPSGVVTVAAGNGLERYNGDGGSAVSASLAGGTTALLWGITVDTAGNLYIADQNASVIRRVDTSGVITTVAGSGAFGFSGDGGPAIKAALRSPSAVVVDPSGNLYIADTGNDRIRLVNTSGVISTIAGNGNATSTGDGGPAIDAGFITPLGLALDAAGNLYVADTNGNKVRMINPAGTITTVAGNGTRAYSGDGGPATKAAFQGVYDVKVDAAGNLYISDFFNQRIRQVNTSGIVNTIAGSGTGAGGFGGDGGAATSALLNAPMELAIDSTGAVIFADEGNNRVRRVVPGGSINTIAGQTLSIGDGGPSTLARLTGPTRTAVDTSGNLYIADTGENRIRKVTPGGTITTLAGTGAYAFSGNGGPASSSSLNTPEGVAVDGSGNVYIADTNNGQIREVNPASGVITMFAGGLDEPVAVGVDGSGNVYTVTSVPGSTNAPVGAQVQAIVPGGSINTYAGGGPAGFAGDNGPATQAILGNSLNIAAASNGTLYIADTQNNRVRRVDPSTHVITTVAGNGQSTVSGNGGPATAAGLPSPTSVALDAAGNLYIGTYFDVRVVNSQGVINNYAGDGQDNFSGDNGPAAAASITSVPGLSVDSAGNLYIADNANNRIRIVQAASGTLSVSPASLTFTPTGPTSQNFAVSAAGSGTLSWATAASTSSGGSWLSASPVSGSSASGQPGTPVTVTVKPAGLAAGDYYGQIQVTSSAAADAVQTVTVRLTLQTAGAAPPQVASGGVLSNASYSLQAPVSPGMLVSIFGTNFTEAGQVYTVPAYPLPTQLGTTSVTIGGELVPLFAVTPDQINAVLPFDLPVNTSLPLVVTYGNSISAPEPVNIAAAEPGIFTASQNGLGLGIVVIAHANGSQVLAGPNAAASAGDVLVIYCTGLGDVNPRGVAASPAPVQPLEMTVAPVTATIGGVNAPVGFAGPTPGFAGLYQVNVTVPAGITPSTQAPLVLTQSGQSSPTAATIPIQ